MTRIDVRIAACMMLVLLAVALTGCPTAGTSTLGDTTGNTDLNTNSNGGGTAGGAVNEVEPDDFEEGADLTNASKLIKLYTATADNEIVELFTVTANADNRVATGDKVFGHANIPFFNNDRRLYVQFAGAGAEVSLVFVNGEAFDPSTAHLVSYDADGHVLDEYVTKAIQPGESEKMTVNGAMKYAVAYIADGDGSFGRFDALTFITLASATE